MSSTPRRPATSRRRRSPSSGARSTRRSSRATPRKQWQTDPTKLSADIITRLPVRYNFDNQWFNDKYEGLPVDGYTAWLTKMAEHPNIDVRLETDFFDVADEFKGKVPIIYTGPVDEPSATPRAVCPGTPSTSRPRSSTSTTSRAAVMNYNDQEPGPGSTSSSTSTPSAPISGKTVIVEYSRFAEDDDEPYYPINTAEDREKLLKYRELAKREPMWFSSGAGWAPTRPRHAHGDRIRPELFENKLRPHFADGAALQSGGVDE